MRKSGKKTRQDMDYFVRKETTAKLCSSLSAECKQGGGSGSPALSDRRKGKEGRKKRFPACVPQLLAGESVRTDMHPGCSQPVWSHQGDREGTDLV